MKKRRSLRSLIRILGPGFVTGAADNDPAGIATYIRALPLRAARSPLVELEAMIFAPDIVAVREAY
jgi:hypothetical protein